MEQKTPQSQIAIDVLLPFKSDPYSSADSGLDPRPPEKTISFAEVDNLGVPTLPPATAASSRSSRRYSSNYKVRIANEKFRKDLAAAMFGGS